MLLNEFHYNGSLVEKITTSVLKDVYIYERYIWLQSLKKKMRKVVVQYLNHLLHQDHLANHLFRKCFGNVYIT